MSTRTLAVIAALLLLPAFYVAYAYRPAPQTEWTDCALVKTNVNIVDDRRYVVTRYKCGEVTLRIEQPQSDEVKPW